MPIYQIRHITQYEYDAPVIDSINQIKVYPFQTDDQSVIQQEVFINTDPVINFHIDYWGNRVGTFSIIEPHTFIKVDSRITVHKEAPMLKLMKPLPEIIRLDYTIPEIIQSNTKLEEILKLAPVNEHKRTIVEWCNNYVYENFKYEKGITNIETTVDEILLYQKGVCQDFAHILLQMLRTLGITCRYVSGYICPNKNGMRGEGATHAWVEVWLDEYGWHGIDPTNKMWVTDTHIKLAVGRNFEDCSPVKGTFKGLANQSLSVYVSIGFEDGHFIEDNHQVTMQKERVAVPAFIPKQYYAQQQQ